ncbi:uncharacterized protein LOC106701815 [Latimeria chalumnae]|uniref:uncharacterized protein LOC106701815 n=1 Tax=Latimeria chalumnae TaxID=7897 RepID=UPI00313E83FD
MTFGHDRSEPNSNPMNWSTLSVIGTWYITAVIIIKYLWPDPEISAGDIPTSATSAVSPCLTDEETGDKALGWSGVCEFLTFGDNVNQDVLLSYHSNDIAMAIARADIVSHLALLWQVGAEPERTPGCHIEGSCVPRGGLISDELNPDVLQLDEDKYEYDFPKPERRAGLWSKGGKGITGRRPYCHCAVPAMDYPLDRCPASRWNSSQMETGSRVLYVQFVTTKVAQM